MSDSDRQRIFGETSRIVGQLFLLEAVITIAGGYAVALRRNCLWSDYHGFWAFLYFVFNI
jgi:hypothetical protein